MVRVGIVGNGLIGWAHGLAIAAIARSGAVDARLAGAFDVDPARAARFAAGTGATAFDDLDRLLDAVDVVWVCTPTAGHPPIVEAAAARGLAVFCEKPLAPSLAAAERMEAAVRAAGVPAQVGLVLRTTPVFLALRDVLASGRLGRPMAAVFRDDQFFPVQGHYGSTWRADAGVAGGGTLIEHSIHDVDLLRWCLGDVAEVSARTECFAGIPGVEDLATVTLRFRSGAHASLVSVWHGLLTRPSTRRLEVFCERGLAWLDDDFLGPLHVETADGATTVERPLDPWVRDLPLPDGTIGLALRMYAPEDRRFLDAMAGGGTPSPGFADAVHAHRLVDAAYRSAAAGGTPVCLAADPGD